MKGLIKENLISWNKEEEICQIGLNPSSAKNRLLQSMPCLVTDTEFAG